MDTALRQLIRESQMWHRRHREVWFQADDPAIVADARPNNQTRELASEVIGILETLKNDIDDALPQLEALRSHKPRARKK